MERSCSLGIAQIEIQIKQRVIRDVPEFRPSLAIVPQLVRTCSNRVFEGVDGRAELAPNTAPLSRVHV